MPKTEDEWWEEIEVTSTGKRRRYYTATCPICYDSQTADVQSSDAGARTVARGKVMTHIRMKHPEEVKPQAPTPPDK